MTEMEWRPWVIVVFVAAALVAFGLVGTWAN